MHSEYIEQRNGGLLRRDAHFAGLGCIRLQPRRFPERILEEFPLLDKQSRAYGAIAFYLDHKAEIDKYLEETEREFEASGIPLEQADRCSGRRSNAQGQVGRVPRLSIRFQADADLNFDIVTAVRQREAAIDFASSGRSRVGGIGDPEVPERAASLRDHHLAPNLQVWCNAR